MVSDSLNIATVAQHYNTGHTDVQHDHFYAFFGKTVQAHDLKIILMHSQSL